MSEVPLHSEYDPAFEGDEFQPAFDSDEAKVFQRLAGHVRFNINQVSLTKADLELGGEKVEVVVVVAFPETVTATDDGMFDFPMEPLAIIIAGDLYDRLTPRGMSAE